MGKTSIATKRTTKAKTASKLSVLPWTRFMDMNSGGGRKEKWPFIYINAPEDEAKVIFYNRFGHSPSRVSCTCCGDDYSVDESATLQQATAYERNCDYEKGAYVERQEPGKISIRDRCNTADSDPWGLYQTLDQYVTRDDVLIIRADEIEPKERIGEIPRQGYIWCD